MYIHSIPQKKIEGYLRSECYFSILVLFRGYFDTHTHTVIFKGKPNLFPKWNSYTGFTSICPDFQQFPTVQPLFGSYYIILLMDNILPRSIWSFKENRWAGLVYCLVSSAHLFSKSKGARVKSTNQLEKDIYGPGW